VDAKKINERGFMIRKFKGIKILDKPAGKLKRNEKKLTPDDFINSKNYYIVKSFAPIKMIIFVTVCTIKIIDI